MWRVTPFGEKSRMVMKLDGEMPKREVLISKLAKNKKRQACKSASEARARAKNRRKLAKNFGVNCFCPLPIFRRSGGGPVSVESLHLKDTRASGCAVRALRLDA